jgi:Cu(I)/Ag(I) efflux system membrane fusion protein
MDTEAALKRAQSSKTKSELQQALSQMINALEPWLQQGKPEHYKSKELKVFKTKTSKQKWIQLSQKPANPYNKEQFDLIPWPEISKISMEQKAKQQTLDTNKSMRGSSHDH